MIPWSIIILSCFVSAAVGTADETDIKETFSTISCKSYAQDSPNYRSCSLQNICYMKAKWTFFSQDEWKLKEMLPVNIGTYDSSNKFNLDSVRKNKSLERTISKITDDIHWFRGMQHLSFPEQFYRTNHLVCCLFQFVLALGNG